MTETKNRKRNRMIDFDYRSDNLYFVTSCTNEKICCFGEIDDGRMILNEGAQMSELGFVRLKDLRIIKTRRFDY